MNFLMNHAHGAGSITNLLTSSPARYHWDTGAPRSEGNSAMIGVLDHCTVRLYWAGDNLSEKEVDKE